jgi:hypothetical protein
MIELSTTNIKLFIRGVWQAKKRITILNIFMVKFEAKLDFCARDKVSRSVFRVPSLLFGECRLSFFAHLFPRALANVP